MPENKVATIVELREALHAGLHAVEWMLLRMADRCRDYEFARHGAQSPVKETFEEMLNRDKLFLSQMVARVDTLMQIIGDHPGNEEPSELDTAMTTPAFEFMDQLFRRE